MQYTYIYIYIYIYIYVACRIVTANMLLIKCERHNVTICINIKKLKIVIICRAVFHNNFLIVLHKRAGWLALNTSYLDGDLSK